MGQIKCKMTRHPPPLPSPPQTSVCATARLWLCCHPYTVMSLPPSPSPCLSLSVCCAQDLSNGAQFFLKKEKSLLSRSEMR